MLSVNDCLDCKYFHIFSCKASPAFFNVTSSFSSSSSTSQLTVGLMEDHVGSCRIIGDLWGIMQVHAGSYRIMQDNAELCNIVKDHAG